MKPKKKRGFRKLVIGKEEYQWKYHSGPGIIDIRTPQDKKYLVKVWEIQGYKSAQEWVDDHEDCCKDGCCDPCSAYTVTPRHVRAYIDKNRKETK